MSAERWAPVTEFPDHYEVSDRGRIRRSAPGPRTRPGRLLALHPNRSGGWLQANLSIDGRRVARKVHTLVALAFVGPRPSSAALVRHLDGDRLNNLASNLAWGTQAENVADTLAHGRHNMARKTRCPAGHPYDDENTSRGTQAGGRWKVRKCRACARDYYHRTKRSGR